MGFIKSLFAANDAEVDSIIVGGMLAMWVLCGLEIYASIRTGAFEPLSFSGAVAGILGSIGAGKRVRDGAPQP